MMSSLVHIVHEHEVHEAAFVPLSLAFHCVFRESRRDFALSLNMSSFSLAQRFVAC